MLRFSFTKFLLVEKLSSKKSPEKILQTHKTMVSGSISKYFLLFIFATITHLNRILQLNESESTNLNNKTIFVKLKGSFVKNKTGNTSLRLQYILK